MDRAAANHRAGIVDGEPVDDVEPGQGRLLRRARWREGSTTEADR